MQYMGGKTRIAAELVSVIDKERRPGQLAWDAFCGGLSVSRALLKRGPVLSTDACVPLISLYLAVQAGWETPSDISPDIYRDARLLPDSDPLKAFCGFGMSFGGKWFGGLSRPRPKYARPAEGCGKVLKRDVLGLDIRCVDFMAQAPCATDALLYLDPPYAGTTAYGGCAPFDSDAFAVKVDKWARFTTVFVSEYNFPIGEIVWEKASKTVLACGISGAHKIAKERLYRVARRGPA